MTFDFHPEAEAELTEAIDFYEEVQSTLGEEFSLEVFAAIGASCRILMPGPSWRATFAAVLFTASRTASSIPSRATASTFWR